MQKEDYIRMLITMKNQSSQYELLAQCLESGSGDPYIITYLMLQHNSKALKPLVKGLSCPNTEMRFHCINCLLQLGDKKAVMPLIEMFDDPINEPFFCEIKYAIEQLCVWGGTNLIYSALHSGSPVIRANMAGLLSEAGDENIFRELLVAINDQDVIVFTNVCYAIDAWAVYLNDRDSASDALSAYLSNDNPLKRAAAVYALGNAGNRDSSKAIINAVGKFPSDKEFHIEAGKALAKISEGYKNELLGNQLYKIIIEKNFIGKEILLQYIFDCDTEKEAGKNDNLNVAKQVIISTEDKIFTVNPETIRKQLSNLIKRLSDDEPKTRTEAADKLGELANRKATPYLCKALYDYDPDVQLSAIKALRKIGDKRATETFVLLLPQKTCYHREDMAAAMGHLRDRKVIPALAKVFTSGWLELRAEIVRSLGSIGGASVIKPLTIALYDKHPKIRHIAVWKLKDLQHARALKALEQSVTKEKDKHVKEELEWVTMNYYN